MLVRPDRERQAPVVCSHHLLKEPFCRGNVAFRAEHELDGRPVFVHCAVQVLPTLADLHVGLVDAEGGAAHLQVRTHQLVDLGRVALDPPEDGDVIDGQSALAHQFLEISIAERVSAVPADAEQDDVRGIVTPLEGRGVTLHEGAG